jgi:NAD(P)-dependent dehydrogenase (short-subunit alcohol dehydrogenase family)
VTAVVAEVARQLGPADIPGARCRQRPLQAGGLLTLDDWQEQLATNLSGAFYAIRAVLPGMRQ